MLPKINRLRGGADFSRITKTGVRITGENLVLYTSLTGDGQPQIGFIVNRSVGTSVTRHLVSRKLRHNFASKISSLPPKTMLVVRVLKKQSNYTNEVEQLVVKAITKLSSQNNQAQAWSNYFYSLSLVIKNLYHRFFYPVVSTTHLVQATPSWQS